MQPIRADTQQPTSKPFELSAIRQLALAGWAGRNSAVVEAHILELAALGVPRPSRAPIFYRVSSSLLTTADVIEVVGPDTSGEVEFVLAMLDDGLWVGLGSDQTDRSIERTSVAHSKQLCAKVVAPMLWRYDDLADHWDRLRLRSWTHRRGTRERYQDDTVAAILPPERLIAMYDGSGALDAGTALFSGTVAALAAVGAAEEFEMELEDPVLERTIHHRYRIVTLPANA
ncbi:MAG: DUF2848 domain-containing protein [bacterium]